MMRMSADAVRERAEGLQSKLQPLARLQMDIAPGESVIGGGAGPSA